MSTEERAKILKMVEDGRINAAGAITLMKALDEDEGGDPRSAESPAGAAQPRADEFEAVAARARRFWQIPLWLGVGLTVLSAYWIYTFVHAANYGFWFYVAWLPFLLGLLFVAWFGASRRSPWVFVRVDRSALGDWPREIVISLPLPLDLARWFLEHFGPYIQGLEGTHAPEMLEALSRGISPSQPLIVHVDDGDQGERVQVYIG